MIKLCLLRLIGIVAGVASINRKSICRRTYRDAFSSASLGFRWCCNSDNNSRSCSDISPHCSGRCSEKRINGAEFQLSHSQSQSREELLSFDDKCYQAGHDDSLSISPSVVCRTSMVIVACVGSSPSFISSSGRIRNVISLGLIRWAMYLWTHPPK